MSMVGWPYKSLLLRDYAIKWIGPENQGVQPKLSYWGDKVDIYSMLYTRMADELNRGAVLPPRRPCVPYKDPTCWKRKSMLLMETCEFCCSAFQHKGGRGKDWCWQGPWKYMFGKFCLGKNKIWQLQLLEES